MHKRRGKFSLSDLLVVALGLIVLAGLAFLFLGPVIRSTKRGQVRETISSARDEVVAFAKSEGRLPSPREFSTIAKNTDPWGGTLFYMADSALVASQNLCCAQTEGLDLQERGTGKQGIAFIIVSEGKNRHNDTGQIPPFDVKEQGAGYDDFVTFMSIEDLRRETRCDPVQITSANLPVAVEDLAYSARLSATALCGNDDSSAFVWTLAAGSLPSGLSLGTHGTIDGIADTAPYAPGAMDSCEATAIFTVRAEHTTGLPAEKEFSMRLVPQRLRISYLELPLAIIGASYSKTLQGAGGEKSYAWAVTQGEMPPGLNLNGSTGVIAGKPRQGSEGAYPFTVTLSDGCGSSARREFAMRIDTCPPFELSSPDHLTASPGLPFSVAVEGRGGYPPYSHLAESCSNTCEQFGITLDCSAGGASASGIPSGPGTCSFSVAMKDSCPAGSQSVQKTYVIRIDQGPAKAVREDSLAGGVPTRSPEPLLPFTSD